MQFVLAVQQSEDSRLRKAGLSPSEAEPTYVLHSEVRLDFGIYEFELAN